MSPNNPRTETSLPAPAPVLDEIFRPYVEGQPAVLLSQRSLFDLVVDEDGKMRPLIEALRRACRERHGLACVTYSMAAGVEWASSAIDNDADRRTIEQALRTHGLVGIAQDEHEVLRVLRGVASAAKSSSGGHRWADGRDMRVAFLLMFAEHLTPGSAQGGLPTDAQIVASELVHSVAQSLALRSSANYIMFHGNDGLIDALVCGALQHVRLRQPDASEKKTFLRVAQGIYTEATFASGVTLEAAASLTANTPNRGLESLLRASHRTKTVITAHDLMRRKSQDVEQLSEGTLTLLDTEHIDDVALMGRNIETPRRILSQFSKGLLEANSNMPANVLLAGPPGTGKTQMTKLAAREGQAAAYLMNSPKGPYVGQTERLARQQQTLLSQWTPNVALCDEITEAFPLERSDFDGDSGASRAVMAQLLTSLSDEGRRGKSLLVATTNCPWRIGAAMRSRFAVIPVLHPLEADFPVVIGAIAAQIDRSASIRAQDTRVQEAARVFYGKGANPRHIRAALSSALLQHEHLDEDAVLWAALDFCGSTDLLSAIYADYWAIKCCVSRALLPWASDPSSYPFPAHLSEVVDRETGEVDHEGLDRRIQEMKPHANL